MSYDPEDPLFEKSHRRWMERLNAGELAAAEVEPILEVMKARKTFLERLLEAVQREPEFAHHGNDLVKAIHVEAEEIRQVEAYLLLGDGRSR